MVFYKVCDLSFNLIASLLCFFLVTHMLFSDGFSRNKDHLDAPITTSFYNLVRYHLGSVAFGSLLIALVQMARTVFAWLQEKLKGSENDISKCLFRTCQCCLYCFEKILKYLTRNAFIEIGNITLY